MGNCFYDDDLFDPFPPPPAPPPPNDKSPLDSMEALIPLVKGFPRHAWDADLIGLLVLAEFMQAPWRDIRVEPPPLTDSPVTRAEIAELLAVPHALRHAAHAEIVQQDRGLQLYFLRHMGFSAKSHPAAYEVVKGAARVGESLMVHFKHRFNRPRPQQICPALPTPLPMPRHPAYPSGHALVSYLTYLALADVSPGAGPVLRDLALRIGRNREIAGYHYPSDTLAGVAIAEQAYRLLAGCPYFAQLLHRARAEWQAGEGRPQANVSPAASARKTRRVKRPLRGQPPRSRAGS